MTGDAFPLVSGGGITRVVPDTGGITDMPGSGLAGAMTAGAVVTRGSRAGCGVAWGLAAAPGGNNGAVPWA